MQKTPQNTPAVNAIKGQLESHHSCSTSLIIMKMQIKTIMSIILCLLNGYNRDNKRNVGKGAEKRVPLCIVSETVLNWYSHYEK